MIGVVLIRGGKSTEAARMVSVTMISQEKDSQECQAPLAPSLVSFAGRKFFLLAYLNPSCCS